jgi:hypothetical protein
MSGGALPTSVLPSSVTLRSVQPTRTSVAHSLKRTVRTRGAQRWGMRLSWSVLNRAYLSALYAFLLAQRGQTDTFTATLAGHIAPQGTWLGSPVVNGAGQTGRSVALRGFTASQAAAVKAGDLLKFAGHTKVYMVTTDAASDGTGLATLTIEPQLIATIADAEALVYSSVPFTVALAGDNLDTVIAPGMLYTLDIDLVEVF